MEGPTSDRRTHGRSAKASRIACQGVCVRSATRPNTERFVRRLVAERRVAFYKVGKFVHFDPDRIDAWLAATSVDCT